MKITKFIHSCLLIEENNKVALVDPGIYSTELLRKKSPQKIDYLLVTHEHADHMDVSFIKELVEKFKDMKIISTFSVSSTLAKEGLAVSTSSFDDVRVESVPHEKIIGQTPENVLFHIFEKFTHPGDSHSFHTTQEILALPVQAPWGSMVSAVDLALRLKPRVVIPIHDWHWRDEARNGLYTMLTKHFHDNGIKFISIVDNEAVEI